MKLIQFVVLLVVWCIASARKEKSSSDVSSQADALIAQMTLEEKVGMLHGSGWRNVKEKKYTGFARGVERLNIPDLKLNDGPQGFRSPTAPGSSTMWSSALSIAASFDRDLVQRWGKAMAEEFSGKGANVFLGPGMNVARVPVNGRNFEYISGGDAYLGNQLVGPLVTGLQSVRGIIANAKHWVNNNQETDRTTNDAIVSTKIRRELYYYPFEGAIAADVGSFMCSYNKINGDWSCENPITLKHDLKDTLGFEGWVMSDWGATHSMSIEAGLDQEMPGANFFNWQLKRGVADGSIDESVVNDSVKRILMAMIKAGLMDKDYSNDNDINSDVTSKEHSDLAQLIVEESTILLKNDDNTLPLDLSKATADKPLKIAVIGAGAVNPIVGGGGSGMVYPASISTPYNALLTSLGMTTQDTTTVCDEDNLEHNVGYTQSSCINFSAVSQEDCQAHCKAYLGCYKWSYLPEDGGKCFFAPTANGKYIEPTAVAGTCTTTFPHQPDFSNCNADKSICIGVSDAVGEVHLDDAKSLARDADIILLPIGQFSAEGNDRADLTFSRTDAHNYCQVQPEFSQDTLVSIIANERYNGNKGKLIVSMTAPGAILTPWRDNVDALFHHMMPGQEYGRALISLMTGKTTPSGKLPLTLPHVENEVQFTTAQYPGVDLQSNYTEGHLVDHLWYKANKDVTPAYVFGYGLSYTSFEYSDIHTVEKDGQVSVSVTITNTGSYAGKEIVQLYLTFPENHTEQPPLQLRGFDKTALLQPKESQVVTMIMSKREYSMYCCKKEAFVQASGSYKVTVGASSSDLRLSSSFDIQ